MRVPHLPAGSGWIILVKRIPSPGFLRIRMTQLAVSFVYDAFLFQDFIFLFRSSTDFHRLLPALLSSHHPFAGAKDGGWIFLVPLLRYLQEEPFAGGACRVLTLL